MGLPRRHFRHGENGSRLRFLEISRKIPRYRAKNTVLGTSPGVFELDMKGGCFWEMFWKSGFERNRRRGVASCQVGVGGQWGQPNPRLHAPHAPLAQCLVHRLNGSCFWHRHLALMPWLAPVTSCVLLVHVSIDLR